jgi:membrane protease subunit HflK
MNIPKKSINIGGEIFEVPDLSRLFGKGIWGVVIVVSLLWALSGFYIVDAAEQGVIRRFGSFSHISEPGIHWHIPFPFEVVDKPKVKQVKRAEIGFRTVDPGPPARYADRKNESLMLTGNLNIVDADMIVQYRILDPVKYLFNVRDLDNTVRLAAEAALRQVIGQREIDEALTTGKGLIQADAKDQLQAILDTYKSGITVIQVQLQDVHPPDAVIDAFKDVASAKEDQHKMVNQAQGYQNDVIPRTRGEAARMVKEAEAWAFARTTKADGNAHKFINILRQYNKAKNVTRKRLFLETMEEILPGVQKYIIQSDKNGNLMNIMGAPGALSSGGGR